MRVVQVAAEFAPIAKTGGLGEVVVGLSRELTRLHIDVEVLLPKYDFIQLPQLKQGPLPGWWSAQIEECRVHLWESPLFQRGQIYGEPDDAARFLAFSRAAMEFLRQQKKPIDVLHLHDWHTAPMARLARVMGVPVKATVLSIHNAEYQGRCSPAELAAVGLPPEGFEDPVYPDTMNLLRGGIVHADALVAVSPSYAQEILTPACGFGLEGTLRGCREKLSGILNGIDLQLWDPAKDPHIPAHYGKDTAIANVLKAKQSAQHAVNPDVAGRPWFGAIARLVPQKNPESLEQALHWAIEQGAVFALLGSSPIPKIQSHFEALAAQYCDHPQVVIHLGYDEALAHRLYAALNFLVVPSRFEPCGLTQLIGMHYGVVPIVRSVGGLKDTVFDHDDPKIPAAQRNGFVFHDKMQPALERALHLWKSDPASYAALVRRALSAEVGWEKPTQAYMRLFNKLTSARAPS